jgi:hypothetical protein
MVSDNPTSGYQVLGDLAVSVMEAASSPEKLVTTHEILGTITYHKPQDHDLSRQLSFTYND